ncbi:PP2C family protein-serine/threonine phosphatase [Piscicoccus intestinalis]|uniref:PP2C family protein-serine/threonine phosphatase n=1 Tax=Piscicoccus intestinalis TaxID=746033 RepID=UPI00083862B8|nr:PP2C family serine/threonine-protein phosphatase [Piscicoccus intestinalis]
MTVAVRFAARTDVGLVRSRNEDSGYAGPHLLAVADGMGGHAGGNVASSLVLARLAPLDGDSHGADDALELLADTVAEANRSLARAMAADPGLHGMGTTLTALMRCGANGLALVHIGDSRAYLLRDGQFSQITRDHSFVQSLVDAGRISEEEAEHHPQRSLVTRVLTGAPEDEPDLSMRQARIGDRYLICSDGLSDYVGRDTIEEVVGDGPPADAARRLVDLAMRAGAPDNVTCVVGDIVKADSGSVQPIVVGAVAERRAEQTQPIALSPAQKAAALRRTVVPAAPDEPDLDDEPRRRGRVARIVALSVILGFALIGGLYGAYAWTQQQLFVGESGGKVAIFQGLPQQLGPITLSSVQTTSDVDVANLPDYYRDLVQRTIPAADQGAADAQVTELRNQAAACEARRSQGIPCGSGQS